MLEGQALTLPVILGAGLVDSLNPCAFALLLVFVATMLTMIARRLDAVGERAARTWLLSRGGGYVIGIFLTYLALGLGLFGSMEAAQWISSTHLVSRLAAFFALGLGLLALQEVLLPEGGTRMTAHVDQVKLKGLVGRLTIPALFGAAAGRPLHGALRRRGLPGRAGLAVEPGHIWARLCLPGAV